MLSKLLHLRWFMWGWVFGRTYWVPIIYDGPTITTTATTATTANTSNSEQITWYLSPPSWRLQRFRFGVPDDATEENY